MDSRDVLWLIGFFVVVSDGVVTITIRVRLILIS